MAGCRTGHRRSWLRLRQQMETALGIPLLGGNHRLCRPGFGGRGIGSALYSDLLPVLASRGIHAVMGGIGLPNDASVALHEKCGFKKVAHLEHAGFKVGRWIDLGYWQKLL